MPYQLPQAAKTPKFLNLPPELLAIAEKAMAEKFGLPEVVKEAPKKKKVAREDNSWQAKVTGKWDDIEERYVKIDYHFDTPYGQRIGRTMMLDAELHGARLADAIYEQIRNTFRESERYGRGMSDPRGYGYADPYSSQAVRGWRLVIYARNSSWHYREGDKGSLSETIEDIVRTIKGAPQHAKIANIRF